jgi:nitroimidazol reductase NimA-like FMN-containing flavoprotein (pyridoxamine 5'-phosphate oxidase superfamily)
MFEHMSQSECIARLVAGRIGRVGVVVEEAPHVLPVNYTSMSNGAVVFRTAEGSLLAQVDGRVVVFEVDGFDVKKAVGWSVCVHGVAREITDGDDPTARRLQELSVVTWAPGQRDRWFAITPDMITGRRLPLTAKAADFGWMPGVVG